MLGPDRNYKNLGFDIRVTVTGDSDDTNRLFHTTLRVVRGFLIHHKPKSILIPCSSSCAPVFHHQNGYNTTDKDAAGPATRQNREWAVVPGQLPGLSDLKLAL